jgi:hypothetical protein
MSEQTFNALNRRSWTRTFVRQEGMNNVVGTPTRLTAAYTIPAGDPDRNSEYEVYAEGDGVWGFASGQPGFLTVGIQLGPLAGDNFSVRNISALGGTTGATTRFLWWIRGTVSLRTDVTWTPTNAEFVPALFGQILPLPPGVDAQTQLGVAFSQVLAGGPADVAANRRYFNPTIANPFHLNGNWSNSTPGVSTGARMTSYKTRITRRN